MARKVKEREIGKVGHQRGRLAGYGLSYRNIGRVGYQRGRLAG